MQYLHCLKYVNSDLPPFAKVVEAFAQAAVSAGREEARQRHWHVRALGPPAAAAQSYAVPVALPAAWPQQQLLPWTVLSLGL